MLPLNSIVPLARLLMGKMDGDLTPEQMKQVRFIEASARDLQDMENDLLDPAKVEAGKRKIRTKRFEVQESFSALNSMLFASGLSCERILWLHICAFTADADQTALDDIDATRPASNPQGAR